MSAEKLSDQSTTADQRPGIPATSTADMDRAVERLQESKEGWARASVAERRQVLAELRHSFDRVASRWVDACVEAEGIPPANPLAAEEWLAGPYFIFRNLRLLDESLQAIETGGRPAIPGPVRTRGDGKVTAQVFPQTAYDKIFYPDLTAEVWMEPEVTPESLPRTQATAYFDDGRPGGVCLVLGAGNVSSIGPMDALYKLFVDLQVVLFKAHPVNDYLGPLMEEGFAPLVRRGLLQVVYGGVEEGEYLCQHEGVDEIHITGSDKTVEAIVFGVGEEGERRKAERRPRNPRPVSSELGNVSPVIVVPGPWSTADLAYQSENIVSMLTNNAGFNCNATRVVITHSEWGQRGSLLEAMRERLRQAAPRRAYYPGAGDRWQSFVDAHPEAEHFGEARFGALPWTFIPHLDPKAEDEICFETEAFCGVFGEVPLSATDPASFIAQAVDFANQRLWGTLNVTLLIHPESLADPAVAAAFEQAIADLRYGTVSVNHWAAVGYGLVVTPWGAYPGHELWDVQSGQGVVHNTLMFSRVRKSVCRAPFRVRPKPPWFVTHKGALEVARRLTEFEKKPSPWKLPGIFKAALSS